MARLNVPTKLKQVAACVSKTANPAASLGSASSRSVASISRLTVTTRPAPVLPAASRTTSAVSIAPRHKQSAHVSAVSQRASSGDKFWALRGFKILDEASTEVERNDGLTKTRIPRPQPLPQNIAKWTHARWYVVPVQGDRITTENEENKPEEDDTVIINRGAGAIAFETVQKTVQPCNERDDSGQEELSLIDEVPNRGGMCEITEDDGMVLYPDSNPDLLHDESFDDTVDGYHQTFPPQLVQRLGAKMATILQGGRVAQCAWMLRRPIKLNTATLREPSRIPLPQVVEIKTKARKFRQTLMTCWAPSKRQHRPGQLIYDMTFKPELNRVIQARIHAKVAAVRQPVSQDDTYDKQIVVDAPSADDSDPRPDSAVFMKFVSENEEAAVPISVPQNFKKVLRFSEDPAESILFDPDAPAVNLRVQLDTEDGWASLKLNTRYHGSSQSIDFRKMFHITKEKTIRLERRVLHRFKAVQEYEKQRKHEAMATLPGGEYPPLGQLEYGNADFKISLQAKKMITANDIGMFKDPSEIGRGILCSIYNPLNGPLLHFGGFTDEYDWPFEDGDIPIKTTAAYKKPIPWVRARTQDQLEHWIESKFSVMQLADLET